MAVRRASVTWQEGVVAVLAIVLALTGAVTVLVRNSESGDNSNDLAKALKGLSSVTTVSSAPGETSTTVAPFVAQDAGFSAEFPVEPERQEQQIQRSGLSLHQIFYVTTTSDEVVGAASAVFPVTPAGKALQDALDGGINGTVSNLGAHVVSRTTISYLGVQAEDALLTAPTGVIRERVLFKAGKIFVLIGITQRPDTPHAGYDRLLATFQTL